MDLTKIDKPFGELDDATKGALLLAQLLGEVIECDDGLLPFVIDSPRWFENLIYRVQPKPVIGDVVFHGAQSAYYSIHTIRTNGYHDGAQRLTFTFPTRDGLHVPGIYTSPEGMQIKIEVAE
jgi:hypothetical protein